MAELGLRRLWSRWEEEGGHGLLFVGRRGALACALGTVVSPGSWPEISAGLLPRGGDEAARRAQLVSGGARCERLSGVTRGAGRGGAGELALGERPGRAGCWAGCWAAREVVAGPAGGRGEALG